MDNKKVYLARNMEPSKEVYEALGFVFSDSEGGILVESILPEGWTIRRSDNDLFTDIYDQDGYKRARMFYQAEWYNDDAKMKLVGKYRVCTKYFNDSHTEGEIYFGNEKEVLFSSGKFVRMENPIDDFRNRTRMEALAEDYANNNYPDWNDPLAYWQDNKNMVLKRENN